MSISPSRSSCRESGRSVFPRLRGSRFASFDWGRAFPFADLFAIGLFGNCFISKISTIQHHFQRRRFARCEGNLVSLHVAGFHTDHVFMFRRIEVIRQFLRRPRIPDDGGLRAGFFHADGALQIFITDFYCRGCAAISAVRLAIDADRETFRRSAHAIVALGKVTQSESIARRTALTLTPLPPWKFTMKI